MYTRIHVVGSVGLLKVGVPKDWKSSKSNLRYIRKAGVRQFISTYNRVKDLRGDALLWGDEIEYGIFALDDETKKIRLSLRAKEGPVGCVVLVDLFQFGISVVFSVHNNNDNDDLDRVHSYP